MVQDITMNFNLKSLMKFIKDESQHGNNMEPEIAENENNVQESKKQVYIFVLFFVILK